MNFKSITKNAMPAVGVTAGVIAGKAAANYIPVGSDLIKAGAVTVLGLFLSSKKGLVGSVGLGMAAQGISALAGNFIPGITGFGDRPVFVGNPNQMSESSEMPGYGY